jgi:hypothetical protein
MSDKITSYFFDDVPKAYTRRSISSTIDKELQLLWRHNMHAYKDRVYSMDLRTKPLTRIPSVRPCLLSREWLAHRKDETSYF